MAKQIAGALSIVIASLVVYWPAMRGDFIMDDDLYVANSPVIQQPGGLYRIWFTADSPDYWPLTNTVFWVEWRLWGKDVTGYRAVNLVLHILNSLLLWRLLAKLQISGAWIGALLFAIHPLNVASVAWISQFKNLLSMFLCFVAAGSYLRADEGHVKPSGGPTRNPIRSAGSTAWYWFSLFAFLLAMLSKGSAAVLPAVLLLLRWWEQGRITRRDLIKTVPFFVVAAVLTAVNIWAQTRGTGYVIRDANWLERTLGAGAVIWFYLYKALVPLNLAFIYPQWEIDAQDWRWWLPLIGAIAVTIALLYGRSTSYGRPLLMAWLFFCVALVPVMGFADAGFMEFSLVADHYQYLPIVAVVALEGAAIVELTRAVQRLSKV